MNQRLVSALFACLFLTAPVFGQSVGLRLAPYLSYSGKGVDALPEISGVWTCEYNKDWSITSSLGYFQYQQQGTFFPGVTYGVRGNYKLSPHFYGVVGLNGVTSRGIAASIGAMAKTPLSERYTGGIFVTYSSAQDLQIGVEIEQLRLPSFDSPELSNLTIAETKEVEKTEDLTSRQRIEANILATPKTAVVFEDIATHWAKNDIQFTAELGLFKESPDHKFNPQQILSQASSAIVIGRLANLLGLTRHSETEVIAQTRSTQPETKKQFLQRLAILASIQGVIKNEDPSELLKNCGYSEKAIQNFTWNKSITRAEAASLLARYLHRAE
ncbi:MAG: S-layer homology domain-containing protein [Candidatus Margulisiibacteriota bacterium]